MCLRTLKENCFNTDKRHQVALQSFKGNIPQSFSECSGYSNEFNTGVVATNSFINYANVASNTKTRRLRKDLCDL